MANMIPHPYSADSMGLKPGDRIVYRGRDVFQVEEEGTVKALWACIEGTVRSVHDGTPPKALETTDGAAGPFAFVLFDNGLLPTMRGRVRSARHSGLGPRLSAA